jgi:uncharacterized protein YdaU (DUF1376 family)
VLTSHLKPTIFTTVPNIHRCKDRLRGAQACYLRYSSQAVPTPKVGSHYGLAPAQKPRESGDSQTDCHWKINGRRCHSDDPDRADLPAGVLGMSAKTDIWMPLYIGDYLADTAHLDARESGAYLLLLMHEWRMGPLPVGDENRLCVAARLVSHSDGLATLKRLLSEFFTVVDNHYIQPRLERERSRTENLRKRASAGASATNKKRWGNSTPVGVAQVSLNLSQEESLSVSQEESLNHRTSQSQSQSPKKQEQKQTPLPQGKPAVTKNVDPRFSLFRDDFESHFQRLNSIMPPWDGKEASNLSRFLKANPTVSQDQWRLILRNRRGSPVNLSAPLSRWIGNAIAWLNHPADEFGKPLKGTSDAARNYPSKGEHNREALRAAIESGRTDYGGAVTDGHAPGGEGQFGVPKGNGGPVIEGAI